MPQTLPVKKPALRPALLLGAALLLSGCSLLSPKDKEADAMGIDTSGPPAFALEVDAPKDIRELLEKHLELRRFRYQPDLQRRELTRLLGATDANVRDLIGTMDEHSQRVSELLCAASPALQHLQFYYFHNDVKDLMWKKNRTR